MQTDTTREFHTDRFGLDNRIWIGGRGELSDPVSAPVGQQDFRAGAADRSSLEQCLRQRLGQNLSLLPQPSGFLELTELGSFDPWAVLGCSVLEVQRADSIGPGFQQVGELIDVAGVGLGRQVAGAPRQDDALPPCVRTGVADARGDVQAGKGF
ncbi:hypothetical protein [Nakamurella panacisegetis]|uniref:hypothetical protein n=1 Tax=Nakamurella panacisegetis TaxID=1090615 RepID=UPI001E37D286|nr:hypothetical protein [Nakamurella panacisegetis]